jgi:pilus assembly protein Flp/PilA
LLALAVGVDGLLTIARRVSALVQNLRHQFHFAVTGERETPRAFNRQQEQTMIKRIRAFWRDQNGATAIEYGLIAAGISVAIIAVVEGLGSNLNTTFGSVSTALK